MACFDVRGQWKHPHVVERDGPSRSGQARRSAETGTYSFNVPVDTFGMVVRVRGQQDASAYEVPAVRVFVPDLWKRMDLEIEWGFDKATAASDYSGRIEVYDGIVNPVRPLAGDGGTTIKAPDQWRCGRVRAGRRGASWASCTWARRKGARSGRTTPSRKTSPARSSPSGPAPATSPSWRRIWRGGRSSRRSMAFFPRRQQAKNCEKPAGAGKGNAGRKDRLASRRPEDPWLGHQWHAVVRCQLRP